jgi:hypothetical protein
MSNQPQTAHDILATLIVECGVQLPYETAVNLSESDPLLSALWDALGRKYERERQRDAFLASCIYNAMGGKTKPSDFIPKTKAQTEAELKTNLLIYNAIQEARKG